MFYKILNGDTCVQDQGVFSLKFCMDALKYAPLTGDCILMPLLTLWIPQNSLFSWTHMSFKVQIWCVLLPFLSILYLALYRVYVLLWLVLFCIPASHVTLCIPQRRSFFWVPSLISLAEALGKELFQGGCSLEWRHLNRVQFFVFFFRLFLCGPF